MKRILVLVSACAWLAGMAQAAEVNPLSQEPFYAGIVSRAGDLKRQTDAEARSPSLAWLGSSSFTAYAAAITDLSASNLKAHHQLKSRGTDNDLKCILKGVSLDLDVKLDELRSARSEAALGLALTDMSHLLADNADVITAPVTADSGMDCVIEFGPNG